MAVMLLYEKMNVFVLVGGAVWCAARSIPGFKWICIMPSYGIPQLWLNWWSSHCQ